MKMATRLYSTGAVKTKKDAAEAAGVAPGYFYIESSPKNGNPKVLDFINGIDAEIHSEAVDMTRVLQKLGRRAVRNIAELMERTESESIKLKASQDLADRSMETQKTQRHIVESFSIGEESGKAIAAALAEAAKVQKEFAHVTEGDFVRVDMSSGAEIYEREQKARKVGEKAIGTGDSKSQAGGNGQHPSEDSAAL